MNAYPEFDYNNETFYSDVAIDDVEWVECSSTNDIVLDKSLDCDFDQNMCSYQNDIDAVIMWTRAANQSSSTTGPAYDHTTRYGYYAFMSVYYSNTNGKPGRLMSSIQTQKSNQDLCFDFWYLMFGATVSDGI